MPAVTARPILVVATLLALAALGACADVRQNPASSVVDGQAAPSTQQAAGTPPASPTNIPF